MIAILYVDDEPALLEAVKLTLEDTGKYSVEIVSSPELALSMLNSNLYEAIISDYDMPDLNGIDFLRMVRAEYGDIPFILYTGISKEEVLIEAINNGVNFYLQKGGDSGPQFAELIHIIEQAVLIRKTKQVLLENERRFRRIIENFIDTYYRTDLEGRLIFASPSCLTLLGYDSMNEVLNRPNESFWKFPQERDRMIAILKEKGEVRDYEVIMLKKSGEGFHVAVSTRYYTDEDGSIAGVEGIFRDISERKQAASALQMSEERYRRFVEHFHGIAYQIEFPGYLPRIFQGDVTTITGFPEIEFSSGMVCWIDLIHPDDKNRVLREAQCLIDDPDRVGTIEYRIMHRDGQWRWISDTGQSVAAVFNNPGLIQGTIQDITARRVTEEELKTRNEDLNATNEELRAAEEKLEERNLDLIKQQQILNQSHGALREANRQLNLLSGITRHDILNKITVMNGYLTLIKDEITNPEIREYINILETVTNDIEGQIDFTRIYQDLGTHEPFWIPVSSLISTINIPGMIQLEASINSIEIYADPICGKVFENLLDNTMRHGHHVSQIQISHELTHEGLKIIWEDDGVGVLTSEKELIFKRGYGKNTGLGLFLVREILSITDLKIHETGLEGKGARFEILIPKGRYHIREGEGDDDDT